MASDRDGDLGDLIAATPGRARKSARLRRLLPEIERRLKDGVTHEEIVALLNASGLEMTLGTFRNYLYRHRNAARSVAAVAAPGTGGSKGSLEAETATHASAPVAKSSGLALEDILDPEKRGAIGDEYLERRRSLLKRGTGAMRPSLMRYAPSGPRSIPGIESPGSVQASHWPYSASYFSVSICSFSTTGRARGSRILEARHGTVSVLFLFFDPRAGRGGLRHKKSPVPCGTGPWCLARNTTRRHFSHKRPRLKGTSWKGGAATRSSLLNFPVRSQIPFASRKVSRVRASGSPSQ